MDQHTFIFIPDISGFTDFVGTTEMDHSRHIITELLEIIINADQLGLNVSEIEGDAILSYKRGAIPSKGQILAQCERTFVQFHNHLRRYHSERICRCGACETAINLTLKFVAHTGPVDTIRVKDHEKLHGIDVIKAHRLLKNSVPNREYLLMTNEMIRQSPEEEASSGGWAVYMPGSDRYDSIGDISYSYVALDSLHGRISDPDPMVIPGLGPEKITLRETINAPVDKIYENFTDFEKRVEWNREIRDIILRDEKINKAGAIHTCLVGSTSLDIETLGRLENESRIIYGERVNRFRGLEDILTIFTFDKENDQTVITVELDFKPKSLFSRLFRRLLKKMMIRQTRQGLKTLKRISEQQ